jgi:hypothetical protein
MSEELLAKAKEHVVVFPGSLKELNSLSGKVYEIMPGYLFVQGMELPEESLFGDLTKMMGAFIDELNKGAEVRELTETAVADMTEKMKKMYQRPEFIERDIRVMAYRAGADAIIHYSYCGETSFNLSVSGENFSTNIRAYSGSFARISRLK